MEKELLGDPEAHFKTFGHFLPKSKVIEVGGHVARVPHQPIQTPEGWQWFPVQEANIIKAGEYCSWCRLNAVRLLKSA